jgi:hypothetical protein
MGLDDAVVVALSGLDAATDTGDDPGPIKLPTSRT